MPSGSTGDTRKDRVQILIAKKTKGGEVEELPYKPLVLAKLSGNRPENTIRERSRKSINDRNFNQVMQETDVRLDDLVVKNHLPGETEDLAVNLKFNSMKSFKADEITSQVPELKRLVELRKMLNGFMAKMGLNKKLLNEYSKILANTDDHKALLEELKKVQETAGEEATTE